MVLGAIGNEGPIDEEEQFARDLAAKRTPRRARAPRPAARPARAETDTAIPQASAPRDLPTAIMTAAAVAVVAIICFTRVWTTVALAAAIVGVATLELASSLQKRGLRPATLVALVACTMMPIAAYNYGTESYPVFFALVTIVSLLWFLWEITPGRPLPSVASTLLVFAYIGGLGGFAGLVLAGNDGVGLILGVALCVIAYDVVGFFVGSQFGHTAVAPKVSPNKTVEGSIAGMVAAVIVGAVVAGQIAPWTPGKGAVLGVLAAVGAFAGDLCESMLKRDLGLKDFGALLPGHGGVLDRFDSLLFCLPIAYYLALQFKIY
jgi:phosphatidate cytidylyltransferase